MNTAAIGERIHYWRDGANEADFVVERGSKLVGIEVETGRDRSSGLIAFRERYEGSRTILVGPGGTPLADFLAHPAGHWVAPEK